MDREAEVYEGINVSRRVQKSTRKRVDWICEQVRGQRVLDIGCSQGIIDLLLARQGKAVLAIDADADAIAYAKKSAEKEPLEVQRLLRYAHGDFLKQDTSQWGQFDVILLTEVLEHLEAPQDCLQRAAQLLAPEGSAIIMVPFGINAHPDYRQTYYLTNLLREVEAFFDIFSVTFIDQWIALQVNGLGRGKEKITFDERLVIEMEKGFAYVDKLKQATIDALKREQEGWQEERTALLASNGELSANVTAKTEEITALKEACCRAEQKARNRELLQTSNSGQAEEILRLKAMLSEKETELSKKTKELVRAKKLYKDLAGSKLGHLQVLRWRREKAKSKRDGGWWIPFKEECKDCLRPLLNKYPWLRELYSKLRGTAATDEKKTAKTLFEVPEWAYVPQKEFEAQTDRDFYERVKPLIDTLPQSNGCRYYLRNKIRIGIVADQFLLDSVQDAAEFVFLTPDEWQERIEGLDILLIVSAWRGLQEEWRGAADADSQRQQTLFKIIDACKESKIPTIFYSKEDPPNYRHFLPIAQRCDTVFTSCVEVIDDYRRDCGHDRIYVLPFGINPLFHNPVGMRNPYKLPGVIFSGSWMNKYPERCKDMELLLGSVLKAGVPLKIIDRNYSITPTSYRFPPEYWPSISPSIAHDDLQKIHKLYDWALDINTVKTSTTMFANRGYELQACGNLQISNCSVGVNDKLPFVFIANEQQEVVEILKNMTQEEVYRRQIEGVRAMMTGETCFDRIATLAASVGITPEQPLRRCAVIADADTPQVRDMFERQTYPEKILFFAESVAPEELDAFDIVAFFSHEMDYEIFYLEDMINGFKYTACDYITKAAYYSGEVLYPGAEHDFVTEIGSKYRTVFWREAYSVTGLLSMDSGAHALPNGYSIDHFNYNAVPYQEKPLPQGLELSVIVPVYNNGRFLMAKCFASLQRSTIFSKMHVILVDDGSTDGKTPDIVRYLTRAYPNVTAFFFTDGGSGSASRPRNKGVEMADTEYITFLDPDNEAINDSYAAMSAMLKEVPNGQGYDVAVGDMIKCSDKMIYGRYYQKLGFEKRNSPVYFGNMRQLLIDSRLTAISIQALLIRREFLIENQLEQVYGAVGQDTLFGWEVLAHAKSVIALGGGYMCTIQR